MLHPKPVPHQYRYWKVPVWDVYPIPVLVPLWDRFVSSTALGHVAHMGDEEQQQLAFDKEVQSIETNSKFTHGFDKEGLKSLVSRLEGWDELTGRERTERQAADGSNKFIYKMAKKFCVVEIAAGNGEFEDILVERNQDGSAPDLTDLKRVCAKEDWFSVIKKAHLAGGHAKNKNLESRVAENYCRIPRWACEVSMHT
jgi:hypothetical protein